MAKLIYSVLASLDGYIEDERGNFDWAEPDVEVHTFINDLTRLVGTHLLGRRMHETMVFWDSPEAVEGQPRVIQEFAEIWRASEKVVFSRTLEEVSSEKARIEPEFDLDLVRRLKDESEKDISIGGPELAAQAIEAGLVDEWQIFLVPAIVGGGKRAFPDGRRSDLEALEQQRFGNGTIFLRYATRG